MKKATLENFEEYNNPLLYDKENNAYAEDVKFLLKVASNTKGVIIDLACGTGRATIPLAREGHQLIGVDLHSGMLLEAKKKASNLNLQIDWYEQDCTNLNLNVKSNLIYLVGNSFQHFLTNEAQDGLLTSVNNHLTSEGIFVFGTRFPTAEELWQPSKEEYWRTYIDSETQHKVELYITSSYDAVSQVQENITLRRFINADGEIVDESRTNISLRYVFPKEMERILSTNGLQIANVYKDWNENELSNESSEMIYVCKKMNKA
ncbi:class I SAM-dependent methyltransferase [Lysinibacillus sp. SGAir0095]|uniref:class I SAM-dependent methyltransferase n=1 Tax=Lysinibacillus sp. SGAir0095 TaxID=2070463 RepID=UPI00197C596F|nr:class I SAM-dependent methyltransferase [Lysinibacillus sp. SGAir0095]